VEHLSAAGDDSADFVQMDEIDELDAFTEFRVGLRNRLQTRRLGPGGRWHSADLLELDVAYVDRSSDSVNPLVEDEFLRGSLTWHVTDNVQIHSKDNRLSLNDRTDALNVGFNVDFAPDLSLEVDYDYLSDITEAITGKMSMRLSDRYELILYEQYQLASGGNDAQNLETRVTVRRLFHDWLLDLGFKMETGDDDNVAFIFGFGPRGWGLFQDPGRSRR
jgi:hypothetical protein